MNELVIQGKTLEIMRKRANMTQEEGAKIFGHGRSWLNEIEKGRSNITFKDGRKLVNHYGFGMNDYENLYAEVEERYRSEQ